MQPALLSETISRRCSSHGTCIQYCIRSWCKRTTAIRLVHAIVPKLLGVFRTLQCAMTANAHTSHVQCPTTTTCNYWTSWNMHVVMLLLCVCVTMIPEWWLHSCDILTNNDYSCERAMAYSCVGAAALASRATSIMNSLCEMIWSLCLTTSPYHVAKKMMNNVLGVEPVAYQ